jgi:uncharacterized protein (TIGR03067 family)
MKRLLLLLAAHLALPLLGADAPRGYDDGATADPTAELQGAWYSTSTGYGGARYPGVDKANRHVIKGDRWVYTDGGAVVQAGTLRVIGGGGRLVRVDFVVTEGFRKGDTWLAVYERRGDELTWCGGYAGDGRARPAALATKADDGYNFRTLRREK